MYASYISHALDLSRAQNLKPHDDESEDGDYDSEFHASTHAFTSAGVMPHLYQFGFGRCIMIEVNSPVNFLSLRI